MKTMGNLCHLLCDVAALYFVLVAQVSLGSIVSTGNFNEDFYITWSPDHVNTSLDGHLRTLKLDHSSGSGFSSNEKFLFGQFDMKIKAVPHYSAGVVVAYYLQSPDGDTRDEIDFEFLGNVTGQPIILQTNIYINGFDNREERIFLWFDPTEDFHTYSIIWNIHQLVFMVDWKPIRVYKNHSNQGVAYPSNRPMNLMASIWNGENWATRGGQDKINWTYAPFIASYKDYMIDACVWNGDPRDCSAVSETNWWNKDDFLTLTGWLRAQLEWVRKNFLVYDYCQDTKRFKNRMPKECSLPKY
uniref:Xyloglucan endotransglucosylase/hydrolase n=1 Tax=Kalanchoe fedtschenkoi TaxID=63787 RepID=A0A7N0R8Q8_KALFE